MLYLIRMYSNGQNIFYSFKFKNAYEYWILFFLVNTNDEISIAFTKSPNVMIYEINLFRSFILNISMSQYKWKTE